MARSLVLVALVLGVSSAAADVKQDLTKQIKVQLSADKKAAMGNGLAADTKIFVNGEATSASDLFSAAWDLHGDFAGHVVLSSKVKSIEVTVDEARGIAWFHARTTLVNTRKSSVGETPIRLNGTAVKKPAGWQLTSLAYTWTIDDKDLAGGAKARPAAATTFAGDAALAKTFSGWLSTGTLAAAAGTGKIVANGTAGKEYGTGAAVKKLAASWDKLKLAPVAVEAWTLGDIGFVHARVAMPVPKKGVVVLALFGVVVKDGADWRWTSLNWGGFVAQD